MTGSVGPCLDLLIGDCRVELLLLDELKLPPDEQQRRVWRRRIHAARGGARGTSWPGRQHVWKLQQRDTKMREK